MAGGRQPVPAAGLGTGAGANGFSRATLERGLDGFFRQFTPEIYRRSLQDLGEPAGWMNWWRGRRSRRPPAPPGGGAGIGGPYRGGQPAQSHADEHGAGGADAVGAICEVRQRRGLSAPVVRPFVLRSRCQAGRLPGNRRVARRQRGVGTCAVCRGRLRDRHGQR